MKFFSGLVFTLFLFTSCSSSRERQHLAQSQKQIQTLDSELRVGMSLDEVKKVNPDVSECRGSRASFMTCQLRFMTNPGWSVPIVPHTTQHMISEDYTVYQLSFEKDKLARWSKNVESSSRK